jgi:hypothetical protein
MLGVLSQNLRFCLTPCWFLISVVVVIVIRCAESALIYRSTWDSVVIPCGSRLVDVLLLLLLLFWVDSGAEGEGFLGGWIVECPESRGNLIVGSCCGRRGWSGSGCRSSCRSK